MSALLLDTGPMVASLDRSDSHHAWVMQRFATIEGRVITTGAVVTEAACFLQDVRGGIERLFDLIESLRVQIWDCFSMEALRAAEALMSGYMDTPMDFVDATLVLAAEYYGTGNIVTLDERGFRTFRYGRKKSFQLLLQGDAKS
jgi:predicted nucleic acid-binding protein